MQVWQTFEQSNQRIWTWHFIYVFLFHKIPSADDFPLYFLNMYIFQILTKLSALRACDLNFYLSFSPWIKLWQFFDDLIKQMRHILNTTFISIQQ